jgi:Insertion element 4 transposase N-terminal
MILHKSLESLPDLPTPDDYTDFLKPISKEWIDFALSLSGTASLRRRRLPAEQVIWLVIGMALMRNRSIAEVVKKLDLSLPHKKKLVPARSSIMEAKKNSGKK